jgi:hypothetical protein
MPSIFYRMSLLCVIRLSVIMPSDFILNVLLCVIRLSVKQRHYAECLYAECLCATKRVILNQVFVLKGVGVGVSALFHTMTSAASVIKILQL